MLQVGNKFHHWLVGSTTSTSQYSISCNSHDALQETTRLLCLWSESVKNGSWFVINRYRWTPYEAFPRRTLDQHYIWLINEWHENKLKFFFLSFSIRQSVIKCQPRKMKEDYFFYFICIHVFVFMTLKTKILKMGVNMINFLNACFWDLIHVRALTGSHRSFSRKLSVTKHDLWISAECYSSKATF